MARPRRDQNSRMLPVKDRQFGAFTVLVFHTVVFLALIHSCRGQSEIIGPSQPVVATVGEDIILPGYLDPVMNAFDMTVEWARPDLDPRFVLVWRDGVELESKKHPSYEGRTSLFTDELKHGNISLKLSKVKISDEGRYRCFIPTLSGASTVQLVVVPSTPGTPGTPDTTGTPGTRGTPGTPGTPGSLYFIMGSTIGFAALVSIPAVVFVVWKWRNKKFKNKRRSHEDGPEQTEEEKTVTSKGDNTRFHAVMEGEGEGVPLMAGRQEETTVDNGGEEKIESQSERKVPQFVAETHQHQLGTKPEPIRDMDRAVGEWGMKSVTDEKVSLIPAEGETHLKQDMIGRQVQNDGDKGEGEQTMKPVKGDSGLPMVLVGEGQKEQLHNLHTDQEVQKEEETQKQGQLQAVQQPNRRPQTQRNVKRGEKVQLREKELHVDQQQAVRKRRRQDEGKEETQKTKKPKEQNKGETNIEQEVQMEDEGEANIEQEENMDVEGEANREQEEKMEVEANREQEVKDEPQKCDMNSQLGQAHVCQENQQVEPMDS